MYKGHFDPFGCDLNDCKAAASYTVANLHVPALVGTMIPID